MKLVLGLLVVVLCSLEVKDGVAVQPVDPPADVDESIDEAATAKAEPKDANATAAKAAATSCTPTFCANCGWQCNNPICTATCTYCHQNHLCP